MSAPEISIVMPIFNPGHYLLEAISSLQNQSFTDFEVICVDDGSTDGSARVISETALEDERFVLMSQDNSGAGAARNFGFSKASGEYVIFLDGDDLFSPDLLDKLHSAAVEHQADIVACNFSQFDTEGNVRERIGMHTEWLPSDKIVFNYLDCPDYIMSIVNPTPWNKLYKSSFIREKGLRFEEISSSNDITFASVSVASAERVTYVTDSLLQYRIAHSGTISSTKTGKLQNVVVAVESAVRQAMALPYGEVIKNAILRFAVDNYMFALKRNVVDFSAENVKRYYDYVHDTLNSPDFANITLQTLHNEDLYQEYCTVKKHSYESMRSLRLPKVIVSLTSHPGRIGAVSQSLETIFDQTKAPDDVLLWLAEEQFPNKEKDLPSDLLELSDAGKVQIRWCDDLKPHKKYFYAMQEYSEHIVVTVDDDMLYPKRMLEKLYRSYLNHPNAVSAIRVHLVMGSLRSGVLPYKYWIKATDACRQEPSMQLFATGCSGVLYPPKLLLDKDFFDKDAIFNTCLWGDDLWLKAIQVMNDIPVVSASKFEDLKYVPDSQEVALWHENVDQNQNDVQLQRIIEWLDERYGKDVFLKKLFEGNVGSNFLDIGTLCEHIESERHHLKKSIQRIRTQRDKAWDVSKKRADRIKKLENRIRKLEKEAKRPQKHVSPVIRWAKRVVKKLIKVSTGVF